MEHTTRLIGPLQKEAFDGIWPVVEPYLANALERDGWKLRPDDLHNQITSGVMGLYVVQDFKTAEILAALACEVQEYPNAAVFSIAFAGGKDMERWQHLIAEIEMHAKALGCHVVRIPGRAGWARVFPEYREAHRVFEKEIA